jgi:hypothetical protein
MKWKDLNQCNPFKHCKLYKHKGCSHVDGFLCDVGSCSSLMEYEKELERIKKISKIRKLC